MEAEVIKLKASFHRTLESPKGFEISRKEELPDIRFDGLSCLHFIFGAIVLQKAIDLDLILRNGGAKERHPQASKNYKPDNGLSGEIKKNH